MIGTLKNEGQDKSCPFFCVPCFVENTNFALLVSTEFTSPFDEPIAYGKYIAGLANLLGSGGISAADARGFNAR